jgi:formylmethanofuran dehydrogenase subunit E
MNKYNIDELDKYNFSDTYLEPNNEIESFVYEECTWCGKDMVNTNDIWVDENDNYVCRSCAEKYGLEVVSCAEY